MVSKVVSWKLKAHDALREVAIGQALEVSQSDHRVFNLESLHVCLQLVLCQDVKKLVFIPLFEQEVQVNDKSLEELVVIEDLSQEVPFVLAEKWQRVLGYLDLFGPFEQLDCSNVDLFEVYLPCAKDLARDEVSLFVHSRDFDDFVRTEEAQDRRCGPDAKVFEKPSPCLSP